MNKFMVKRCAALVLGLLLWAGHGFAQVLQPKSDVVITVVHTNDTHGRVIETHGEGLGFARMSGYVNALRAEGKNVLLVDAGDTFHGRGFASLSRGESIVEIMNAMGYAAMTAGNHDFNYGVERLLELAQTADFPVLGANVSMGGKPILTPYVIKEFGDLKVGVLGLTTRETYRRTHPDNILGVTFEDPVAAAKRVVGELRERAHIIIALTHLGLGLNGPEATSDELARRVRGIDLIVDGHSHHELPYGTEVNGTMIVQAGHHGEALGIVRVEYDGGKVTRVSPGLITKVRAAELPEDSGVLLLIEKANERNRPLLEEVVAKVSVNLVGEREIVRTGPSNLGRLITDAMIDISGADVALINGGAIRNSISAGPVTRGDVLNVLPFGNTTVVLEVTGKIIVEALEQGVGALPEPSGGYCHTSGIEYALDLSLPPGGRTSGWAIDGVPLNLEQEYTLVTNDFLAAGGDRYEMLKGGKVSAEYGALDEVLLQYMLRYPEKVSMGIHERAIAKKSSLHDSHSGVLGLVMKAVSRADPAVCFPCQAVDYSRSVRIEAARYQAR